MSIFFLCCIQLLKHIDMFSKSDKKRAITIISVSLRTEEFKKHNSPFLDRCNISVNLESLHEI